MSASFAKQQKLGKTAFSFTYSKDHLPLDRDRGQDILNEVMDAGTRLALDVLELSLDSRIISKVRTEPWSLPRLQRYFPRCYDICQILQ